MNRVAEVRRKGLMQEVRRDIARTVRSAISTRPYEMPRLEIALSGDKFVMRIHSPWAKGWKLDTTLLTIDSPSWNNDKIQSVAENDKAQVIQRALRLADKHWIALRRRWAIETTKPSGVLENRPCWAYVAHPVARGLLLASGVRLDQLANYTCPRDAISATVTTKEMVAYAKRMELNWNGVNISCDAGSENASITMDGQLPSTMVQSLVGQPLHQVISLPGAGAGTPCGDAPIKHLHTFGFDNPDVKQPRFQIIVDARFEPLAPIPDGIDTSWMEDWIAGGYNDN